MFNIFTNLILVGCSNDFGLNNSQVDPAVKDIAEDAPAEATNECECPDNSAEITTLQEELASLRERVGTLESAPALEPETTPAVVLSSYRVDCNRQTFMYEEFNVEYTARYAAGTLYGFEGIYSHCPLVMGVEAGNMPHVTVAQVREVEPDTVCEASYCPNTSADGWWYNNNSGGHVVAGGYDDMRMAPGMQLRFDEIREVIYTASDYRQIWSGSGEGPLLYEVTVIGDRVYTAPEGWL